MVPSLKWGIGQVVTVIVQLLHVRAPGLNRSPSWFLCTRIAKQQKNQSTPIPNAGCMPQSSESGLAYQVRSAQDHTNVHILNLWCLGPWSAPTQWFKVNFQAIAYLFPGSLYPGKISTLGLTYFLCLWFTTACLFCLLTKDRCLSLGY